MSTSAREVREAVRAYLADVERHLQGMSAAERRELLAQLESHIHEALKRSADGREPVLADAESVLGAMDPPESYGQRGAGPHSAFSQRWNLGRTALCVSLGSLVLAGLIGVLAARHSGVGLAYLLFVGGQIGAFVLGVQSWRYASGKSAVFTSVLLLAGCLLLTA